MPCGERERERERERDREGEEVLNETPCEYTKLMYKIGASFRNLWRWERERITCSNTCSYRISSNRRPGVYFLRDSADPAFNEAGV